MPKAIIFDWDDTLAHTRLAVVESIEYVLKKYNKEPWDITKTKYRDTKKSLKDNFSNFFGENALEAYSNYLEFYEKFGYSKVAPIEHAHEFLQYCSEKNIDLYIISNKEKKLLLKEISFCFPDIKFSKILGNGDALHNKPAPDPVYKVCEKASYSINATNIWLIGDSKQDTECAYNAGIKPMLLGAGKFMDENYIKTRINSSNPLVVFNNYVEIQEFLIKEN